LSSPSVFQRPVAICSEVTRPCSHVGFASATRWVSGKEFDAVLADLSEMLEDRVTGACRSRWWQKVRRHGCLLGIRNAVGRTALAPQDKAIRSLSVPNNWLFRRRNKRLPGPHVLYFCPSFRQYPCSRRAGGSRVLQASSPQVARELPQPWRCEKTRGLWEPETRA
jgi:hypothetical protein